MKTFKGEDGREWVATAREEDTPRHHGRWYMVLHPESGDGLELMIPEIRWKNRMTADRTIRAMSEFELRRRLRIGTDRQETPGPVTDPFGSWKSAAPGARGGTGAS